MGYKVIPNIIQLEITFAQIENHQSLTAPSSRKRRGILM